MGQVNLHLAALTNPVYSFVNVNVFDLSSKTGAIGNGGTATPGTRTGTALPVDVSTVINHTIRRRYRGGRPRTYMPFGNVEDTSGGNSWSATFQSTVTSTWNDFRAALIRDHAGLVITNQVNIPFFKGFTPYRDPVTDRPEDKPDINPSIVPDVVTAGNCRTILGSQRSRLTIGG